MRAVRFDRFGGPEVLAQVEIDRPEPKVGEVLIEVSHIGVNFAEVMARRGDFDIDLPFVPGLEVAGTVVDFGGNRLPELVGSRVAALTTRGGYAQYALAPVNCVIPLDAPGWSIASDEGAGLPCVGPTAIGILTAAGSLQPDDRVLIFAAAGGVATMASQIARHLGAGQIVGVVGDPGKRAIAAALGSYDVVATSEELDELYAAGSRQHGTFNLILDSIGGSVRKRALRQLRPFGRLVVFGNASAAPDIRLPLLSELQEVNRTVAGYNVVRTAEQSSDVYRDQLMKVVELVGSGVVKTSTVTRPVHEFRTLHEELERRVTTGKLVMTAWSSD